jgi:hypothetical protein
MDAKFWKRVLKEAEQELDAATGPSDCSMSPKRAHEGQLKGAAPGCAGSDGRRFTSPVKTLTATRNELLFLAIRSLGRRENVSRVRRGL